MRSHHDQLSFPTPGRLRDVSNSNVYRSPRTHPYELEERARQIRHSTISYYQPSSDRDGRTLPDKPLDLQGDLGWSLDYTTAWDYKFLVGNQTEVAEVIDRVRELATVEVKTPYLIFDPLDKAMFGGKLKNRVCLRWKAHTTLACGTTSAPGVVPGIRKICIDLNRLPFEENYGDFDVLLDALIHQMIHAFFLVCCGAQPKGAKQDGRLADGLHFGVLLYTIQDISKQCRGGGLDLIFYAARRREDRDLFKQARYGNVYPNGVHGMGIPARRDSRPSFIAISPAGSVVPAAPADGQSHCSHDNRSIRPAQVKNWQVEHYARAIDLNMDQKGDVIYNLDIGNQLTPMDRLHGPPSSTYVELIWDKKRIMVPRGTALQFDSLKRPLEKDWKFELKLPECSMSVLTHLWDFLQHRRYFDIEGSGVTTAHSTSHRARGPPVLIEPTVRVAATDGIVEHIKVFKAAESMKFEELQSYALKRLYNMSTTAGDPIEALKELYNEGRDSGKPIHAELHKWARHFLARREDQVSSYGLAGYGRRGLTHGLSNYEKLLQWHGDRFQELFHRNMALKDDCKLVFAELQMGGMLEGPQTGPLLDYHSTTNAPRLSSTRFLEPALHALPRRRSLSTCNPLDLGWTTRIPGMTSSMPRRSWDDVALPRTFSGPRCLDWRASASFPNNRVCCNR